MSQDHNLRHDEDAGSLAAPLDLTNNTLAMIKAVRMQQQNQIPQEQQGYSLGRADVNSFNLPMQQQISALYSGGLFGSNDQIQTHAQQRQQQQQQQQQQQTLSSQDLQQELKRLSQQISSSGPNFNALLMPGNSNQQILGGGNSNLNATALIQSLMLEQQQRNMAMQAQQPTSPSIQPEQGNSSVVPVLQPGFFQDPRVFIAQNQIGALQHQQDPALPSPHSLFHRDGSRRMRGGVIEPFPEKLMRLLNECEAAGRTDVVSWIANGRAFAIHKPDKFFKEIVPLYFRQSRLSSFKRQLNLYGFELINSGPARGGYFHELFVREQPDWCRRMRRVAIKMGSSKDKEQPSAAEDSASQIMQQGLMQNNQIEEGSNVLSGNVPYQSVENDCG